MGRNQETAFTRGTWVDPRAGRITVAEWHTKWLAARVVAHATVQRNEGHWYVAELRDQHRSR